MKKLITSLLFVLIAGLSFSQANSDNCPCCKPEYRQFDFWVGNWKTTANEKQAGTNKIVLLQDSCVIQENWTSTTPGYTGTSYNYYDPQDKMWHQTWVDNQGQSLLLSGGLQGTSMVLKSGEMKDQNGKPVYHRITWTPNPDGTVRQHWQSSADGNASWSTLFDGLYQRINQQTQKIIKK